MLTICSEAVPQAVIRTSLEAHLAKNANLANTLAKVARLVCSRIKWVGWCLRSMLMVVCLECQSCGAAEFQPRAGRRNCDSPTNVPAGQVLVTEHNATHDRTWEPCPLSEYAALVGLRVAILSTPPLDSFRARSTNNPRVCSPCSIGFMTRGTGAR